MSLDTYSVIQPPSGGPVDVQLTTFARNKAFALDQALDALEGLVTRGPHLGTVVAQRTTPAVIGHPAGIVAEIILVPPRYVLMQTPAMAIVIRVRHSVQTIELLGVLDVYGGPLEANQWTGLQSTYGAQLP